MIARLKSRPLVWLAVLVLGGLSLAALTAMAAGDAAEGLGGLGLVRFAFGTIVAVGALLIGARWLMRLTNAHGIAAEALRVVASLPVGQRERVVVVQVGERQLMLGVAPGRVALIHELAESLPAARPSQAGEDVPGAAWLARVIGRSA